MQVYLPQQSFGVSLIETIAQRVDFMSFCILLDEGGVYEVSLLDQRTEEVKATLPFNLFHYSKTLLP